MPDSLVLQAARQGQSRGRRAGRRALGPCGAQGPALFLVDRAEAAWASLNSKALRWANSAPSIGETQINMFMIFQSPWRFRSQ